MGPCHGTLRCRWGPCGTFVGGTWIALLLMPSLRLCRRIPRLSWVVLLLVLLVVLLVVLLDAWNALDELVVQFRQFFLCLFNSSNVSVSWNMTTLKGPDSKERCRIWSHSKLMHFSFLWPLIQTFFRVCLYVFPTWCFVGHFRTKNGWDSKIIYVNQPIVLRSPHSCKDSYPCSLNVLYVLIINNINIYIYYIINMIHKHEYTGTCIY